MTLPALVPRDVARKSDIDALRAELKGEISELRAELVATAARLDGKIDSIVPKLIATNIASMIGVAGLVLAATQLA